MFVICFVGKGYYESYKNWFFIKNDDFIVYIMIKIVLMLGM